MKNLQLYHRKVIQSLIEDKWFTVAEIAEGLEVSPSTIYRELKRNTHPVTKKYNAEYAHKLYLARKKMAGSKKKNPFKPRPLRKNKYELYAERKYIYWYSDQYYDLKLKGKDYDAVYLKKWYVYRIGKKYYHHKDDWEYYDLWMEHFRLQRTLQLQPGPKYYWMRELIKDKKPFTLWKNPITVLAQKKCV
ncbi:helix-turn-helix domain-containing protein [Flammeovirga sp. EKP202]|uniref:helix-turn-helix domain-containing protein n=1 Tax=Flammeovirga sp. EKP202 TaxID=2770592 RepID=UPI00165F633D|nr:helix-turn-helix domain-containing protein [Flammeovirga sp. EKP202]MBD0399989.1 helix-turn-helix domain-containing protein [Flammeovirga sp. EKP202]